MKNKSGAYLQYLVFYGKYSVTLKIPPSIESGEPEVRLLLVRSIEEL